MSRIPLEAREEQLRQLRERRFDDVELLMISTVGVPFAEHPVRVAVGVEAEDKKHALGLAEGASKNQVVVKESLADPVGRGVLLRTRRVCRWRDGKTNSKTRNPGVPLRVQSGPNVVTNSEWTEFVRCHCRSQSQSHIS